MNIPTFSHIETAEEIKKMITLDWSDEALEKRVAQGTEIEFCKENIQVELKEPRILDLKAPDITNETAVKIDSQNYINITIEEVTMPKHDFGIIETIDTNLEYTYDPEKYNCISVDDDVILPIIQDLKLLQTYFHNLNRPELGIDYYGTTLIPPYSQGQFLDILLKIKPSKYTCDLNELISLLTKSIEKNKYIIHFGI